MTRIFVRFREPGWHRWPDAPDTREYLADRHRHVFHYEVSMLVMHDERDVEFHDLLDEARDLLPSTGQFGSCSCETIAREMCEELSIAYPGRRVIVTVSEDGECGATVRDEEDG